MYFEVSGLVIKLQGSCESLESLIAEYTLPLLKERERICDIEIFIHKQQNISVPEGKELASSGLWTMVQRPNGESVYRTFPEAPSVVSAKIDFYKNRAEISVFSMDGLDTSWKEQLCCGQALSHLLLRHNRMVLHSSCIARNGKAVLFSAPSGTGKSTHTGLWKQYYPDTQYINDDTPILRLDKPGEVWACGSPWSGKTRLNQNISAPLCGIVFLEQGETNVIKPLSKAEAMGRLLGECRKIPFYDSMIKAAELCGQLLERVPVYRLSCNISYEAVETVRKELLL